MSKYRINVSGKEYTVEIDDPNASPATVIVNGQAFKVTVSEHSGGQPVRRARVDTDLEDLYVPTVASTFVETVTDLSESATDASASAPAPAGDLKRVTAPMPGKILDIAVHVGAQVKHGDVLCNLEAMKMKSPVRSTAEGTIVQVWISEGQNVSFGDVLFTLQ